MLSAPHDVAHFRGWLDETTGCSRRAACACHHDPAIVHVAPCCEPGRQRCPYPFTTVDVTGLLPKSSEWFDMKTRGRRQW